MKELLKALTSYQIFNNLFPGALMGYWLAEVTTFELSADILTNAFIFYFLGMIVSRIGSVVIEPVLVKMESHRPYEEYVEASVKDEMLPVLSETNNTYRSVIALFFCVFIIHISLYFGLDRFLSNEWKVAVILIVLFILFVKSYTKQTRSIKKRINVALEEAIEA